MSYLRANWPLPSNIHALTTLRPGGCSQGVFAGLNLGFRLGDDATLVTRNLQQIVQELKLPYTPQWVKQVHGINVIKADSAQPEIEADGIYSHSKGQICAVLTADCLPILIAHPKGLGIAALHGGWRSLQQGIIEAGLKQLALPTHELMVWLGPAIAAKAYVVGADFRETFLENDVSLEPAFHLDTEKQWHADLYTIARLQLQRLGVTRIYGGDYCTYSDPYQFYSARYSLHNSNHTGGRMATLIWIDEENKL